MCVLNWGIPLPLSVLIRGRILGYQGSGGREWLPWSPETLANCPCKIRPRVYGFTVSVNSSDEKHKLSLDVFSFSRLHIPCLLAVNKSYSLTSLVCRLGRHLLLKI